MLADKQDKLIAILGVLPWRSKKCGTERLNTWACADDVTVSLCVWSILLCVTAVR